MLNFHSFSCWIKVSEFLHLPEYDESQKRAANKRIANPKRIFSGDDRRISLLFHTKYMKETERTFLYFRTKRLSNPSSVCIGRERRKNKANWNVFHDNLCRWSSIRGIRVSHHRARHTLARIVRVNPKPAEKRRWSDQEFYIFLFAMAKVTSAKKDDINFSLPFQLLRQLPTSFQVKW